jgi:hypothetical protein
MNRSLISTFIFIGAMFVSALLSATTIPKFHRSYDSKKATAIYNKGLKKIAVKAVHNPLFASPTDFQKALQDAKKNARQVAKAETDVTASAIEATFSPDYVSMRNEILGDGEKEKGVIDIKSLNQLVNKYTDDKKFNELKALDAKFLALQIRALAPWRGFIFRARGYIRKNSVTRTMIVSALRSQISSITHFYPTTEKNKTNYWDIVFQYITAPTPDMGPPISSDVEFYNFMTELTRFADSELILFRDLAFKQQSFWWDTKIYAPFMNYINEKDRYVKLGYIEQLAMYSALSLNLSGLYSTTAYSFDGLEAATRMTGQLFGVDLGDMFNELGVEGMSSENKFHVLNKNPKLFEAAFDMKTRMSNAYMYLEAGVQAAQVCYEWLKQRPVGDQQLFDSRFVAPLMRGTDNSIRNIAGLLAVEGFEAKNYTSESTKDENTQYDVDRKNKSVRSFISSGEVIEVNLKNFYTVDPPKHLNELYPKQWRTEKAYGEEEEITVEAWGKVSPLRNYKYGMAAEWNLQSYQKLFPKIQAMEGNDSRTTEVGKYARILSQTWGTGVFALPLSFFIF